MNFHNVVQVIPHHVEPHSTDTTQAKTEDAVLFTYHFITLYTQFAFIEDDRLTHWLYFGGCHYIMIRLTC